MRAGRFFLAVVGIVALFSGLAAAQGHNALTVVRVEPNLVAGTLLIEGENLVSNDNGVAVTLGGEPLAVLSASANQIIASLPEGGLLPASYLLTVSRGNGPRRNVAFEVAIVDTNEADVISLIAGTGIAVGGSGNSRTITNTGDTNIFDDITSLNAGTGIAVGGSGNSRTITNTGDTNMFDDITSLIAGTGISVAGSGASRTITNTGDTNTGDDITSLTAGVGISISGSGNSRTISAIIESDRNVKENFAEIDSRQVLERVAAMPMMTWNYKSEPPSVRHMGPMAQDFHAAFGLGSDNRSISTLDAGGVVMAAIQGLHGLLREKDAEVARLSEMREAQQRAIAALEARLMALEALLVSGH